MERYKRTPNTKCLVCGKEVYRRPVLLKASEGRAFCGQSCYGRSNRKEKPCIICGILIPAAANKKTCSRACANKNRVGFSYKLGRPRDKANELRAIKTKLFEMRGVKCERCDYNKREVLHVHHKDRNRNNNDFSNLELICPNCHYEEHYLNGGLRRMVRQRS